MKWSLDFKEGSSSLYIITLPIYLIWRVTLQDHLIIESFDFMEGSSLLYVTNLPGLVVIGIVAGMI